MVFAPDVEEALGAAVALVNSEMPSLGDLRTFYDAWGYTGSKPRTAQELRAVQALRPRLRELLLADRDDAVALVNGHALMTTGEVEDTFPWSLESIDPA